jgi:hypothetical protein
MNEKARGMSSGRHGSASDFQAARKAAIETLLTRGVLVREKHQLLMVVKGRRGAEEKVPVTVHATKGLLRHSHRRSTDPLALLKIPQEG